MKRRRTKWTDLGVVISLGISILLAICGMNMAVVQTREHDIREAQLKKMEESYHLVFDLITEAKVAFLTVDERGIIVKWSPGAEKAYGWSENEMRGETLAKLMPEGQVNTKHARAFENHTVSEWISKRIGIDCKIKTKEGQVKRTLVLMYEADAGASPSNSKYMAVLYPRDEVKTDPSATK